MVALKIFYPNRIQDAKRSDTPRTDSKYTTDGYYTTGSNNIAVVVVVVRSLIPADNVPKRSPGVCK